MFRISRLVVCSIALVLVLVACQTALPEFSEGELEIPLIPRFEDMALKTQDISTSANENGNGLAIQGVNLYVVGYTEGNLDGANLGFDDAFLRRYNGGMLWGEQFGGRNNDEAVAVVTDSSGNIYVLGHTSSAMGFALGSRDNFLVKYSKQGERLWVRQFGTSGFDTATDMVIDSNNRIYTLTDEGNRNFTLRKFKTSGTLLGMRSVNPNNRPGLKPAALAVDSLSNLIVLTEWENDESVKYRDIRLYKFNSNLNQIWQKGYGTRDGDLPGEIVTDNNNNIYLCFYRSGDVKPGGYLQKRNANGAIIFTRRLPSAPNVNTTVPETITFANNNIYIAGFTSDPLPGYTQAGRTDIVVFRYSLSGTIRWFTQFDEDNYGSDAREAAKDIIVNGYVYITGFTEGNLFSGRDTSYGGEDAFVAMLSKTNGDILGIDQ